MKTAGIRAFTAKKKYIFITTVLVALAMMSCGERPYINAPGDNSFNNDSIPVLIPDTEGIVIQCTQDMQGSVGQCEDGRVVQVVGCDCQEYDEPDERARIVHEHQL